MYARPKIRSPLYFRVDKLGVRYLPDEPKLSADVAAIVAGLILLFGSVGCEKKEVAPPPMPPEVEVTNVVQQNVPTYQVWVAQLNGQVNADITPKVQGYLLKRAYTEGFFVHKGQLLYEIDPRDLLRTPGVGWQGRRPVVDDPGRPLT